LLKPLSAIGLKTKGRVQVYGISITVLYLINSCGDKIRLHIKIMCNAETDEKNDFLYEKRLKDKIKATAEFIAE